MDYTNIFFTAVLTEGVTQVFKDIFKQSNIEIAGLYAQGFSVVIGIVLAFTLQLDVTYAVNGQVDISGMVITGFLISRGANYLHDLLNKFTKKEGI